MSEKPKFSLANPVHFLALGFGSGLLKPAPGTWGTLAAIPVYLLVLQIPGLTLWSYLGITVVAFVFGIYLCGKTARDVGVHDHGAIVWDELVGLMVSMIAVPPTLLNVLLGFLLFRFFDILKPWPIKALDLSVHGGFGIMIDDVIAGVIACGILHLMQPILVGGL